MNNAIPIDASYGFIRVKPLGIIVAITPYNDPLNPVAHKLGRVANSA